MSFLLKKDITELSRKLYETADLSDEELTGLLEADYSDDDGLLHSAADKKRREIYGEDVFLRGLIEVTNFCKNNCYYCGIRCANKDLKRYRLSKEDIIRCADEGYRIGYRTFVLQGGEDPYYTDDRICETISALHEKFPDCVITLSIGEKPKSSYEAYYKAGARRYLLRHETADEEHYGRLHPSEMSFSNRIRCLYDLKETGFQVGAGFMVGSPFQTTENILKDIRFLQKFKPEMIGIGPFLTHSKTPFADHKNGSLYLTLRLISILRLMLPYALIPATTALGTIHPEGREMGLKAGANVVMPNLSPYDVRKLYSLYENKLFTGEESAQQRKSLECSIQKAGYKAVTAVGNCVTWREKKES